MKIAFEQLPFALLKKLYPVYLVSGDEILLVEEACEQIRKSVQQSAITDRKIYHVDSHFNWQQLTQSISHLSLFGEKTLIELHISVDKINETGQQILIKYLEKPFKDKILLITISKLNANAQKTKWFKLIDQAGGFIPIWPMTSQQLLIWIKQRLQFYQMSADRPAVQLIAEYAEGNLTSAKQAIERLRLLHNDKQHLTYDDVVASALDNAYYDIFALNEAALSGDAKRTLRILNKLKSEGIEPTLILWALIQEIRSLIEIQKLIEQGQSLENIMAKKSIREKQKPLIRSCLRHHHAKSLVKLLQLAAQSDHLIKGLTTGNIWDELKKISLGLCGCTFI
jgi:DNA polymerase-3 subunit delta